MSDVPQLISVRCTHCGAPLELPPSAKFVTCAHCGSQLQVHHSGNAVYTEKLDQIAASTQRIESDVQAIRRQNEIEALDREWEMKRQSLLIKGEHGSTSKPSMLGGVIGLVISVGGGLAWIGFAVSMGAPIFFPIFGVLFILIGISVSVSQFGKASAYEKAEADYERRRQILHSQLNDASQR